MKLRGEQQMPNFEHEYKRYDAVKNIKLGLQALEAIEGDPELLPWAIRCGCTVTEIANAQIILRVIHDRVYSCEEERVRRCDGK